MDESLEFGLVYNVSGNALEMLKAIRVEQEGIAKAATQAARSAPIGGDGQGRGRSGGGGGGGTYTSNRGPGPSSWTQNINFRVDSGPLDRGTRSANALNDSLHLTTLAANASAEALSTMGDRAMQALAGMAVRGVEIARTVEDADARTAFAAGKIGLEYDSVINKIDEISLSATMTRNQLSSMFSDLAIQKINIFDEGLANLSVTAADGTKQATDAMTVIQDAVAFSGKGLGRLLFTIKEASSEQRIRAGKQLAEDLNISGKELVEWNAALAEAVDNQDAFNRLMQLMADRVGGSTNAIRNTLTFALLQIDDWRDKLVSTIFKDTLPIIRDFIRDAGKEVLELTKEGNLDGLRNQITEIAKHVDSLARKLLDLAIRAVRFANEHPEIVKYAAALTVATFSAGKLLGVLSSVGAMVFNLRTLFATMGPAMSAAFIPMIKIAAVLAALGAVATIVARIAVGGETITDTWSRVGDLFGAVFEGFKNMNWTTGVTFIDEDNAKKLESMGIYGTLLSVLGVIFRISKAVDGLIAGLQSRWPAIQDTLSKIFDNAANAARHIAGSLGFEMADAAEGSTDKWLQFGIDVGNILGTVVLRGLELVETLSGIHEQLMKIAAIGIKLGLIDEEVPGTDWASGDIPTDATGYNAYKEWLVEQKNKEHPGVHVPDVKHSFFGWDDDDPDTYVRDARTTAHWTDRLRYKFLHGGETPEEERRRRSLANVNAQTRHIEALPTWTAAKHTPEDLQSQLTSLNQALVETQRAREREKNFGSLDPKDVERIAQAVEKGASRAKVTAKIDGETVTGFVGKYAYKAAEEGI